MDTWEDPEMYQIWTQNQANQNDWPKETRKKCPIYVIQTSMRVRLSDCLSEAGQVVTDKALAPQLCRKELPLNHNYPGDADTLSQWFKRPAVPTIYLLSQTQIRDR